MDIEFSGQTYVFQNWRPNLGKVFKRTFSFDCETTLIDKERSWITPAYVIGAAFDGKKGYFLTRKHVAKFWELHDQVRTVFHNAAFDLDVIHCLDAKLDVYKKVDFDLVWDTWLLHRLFILATCGHTAGNEGEATLESCAKQYLQCDLPKDITDSKGNMIRTSYGMWLNQPTSKMPTVYWEYLAKDVIATRKIYRRLRQRIKKLLTQSQSVWGYVSKDWLNDCQSRWGPLTHHIQLRAAIVLREITRNGLHVDLSQRDQLNPVLESQREQLESRLRMQGVLVKGTGSQKALQAKFNKLEFQNPDVHFPKTESGLFATSAEVLHDLVGLVPFVEDLFKYRTVDKLLETFLNKLSQGIVHASFGVLARSGRTSSFGELNAQNLPKDDRVRNCFIPSPGHIFLDLDYATIELAALAQACTSQFGWESEMAKRINAGDDLHRVFAAYVTHKAPDQVSSADRARAKPINSGKPGGMGIRSLQTYAKTTYGIDLSETEVEEMSEHWLDLFPEMRQFLINTTDTPFELARVLGLTLTSHYEHTDDARSIKHSEHMGQENRLNRTLGMMCLKVLGHDEPQNQMGKRYPPSDLDYFWVRLDTLAERLPKKHALAIRSRRPSKALQRSVSSYVGQAGVFVLTGRLRAAAGFTARHNTIFQGLTSDGAKLGLWRVWRKGIGLPTSFMTRF